MNTSNQFNFRALAVASLIAIGIATTIASGGGGGGGTTPEQPPPPPEMLAITAANGEDVSSTLILALNFGFDLGDITGGGVTSQVSVAPPTVLQRMRINDLLMQPSAGKPQKLENCAVGGTIDATATLADPNTLTVGDTISAVLVNCDDGDGVVISGMFDLTVAAYQGDVLTGVFLLGIDVVLTNVEITQGSETVTSDGDFTLTLDSLDFPVIAQTMAGTELSFGYGPEVITLFDFNNHIEVDAGVMPQSLLVIASGTLDSLSLGGTVDYETPVAVRAVDDEDPYTGEILITGANGSNVRIVINDSSSITLEVDTNGDGVVDEFIDTNFAALNGNT